MKLKQPLALLLTIASILCIFTGCGNSIPHTIDKDTSIPTASKNPKPNNIQDPLPQTTTPSEFFPSSPTTIDLSRVSYASPFSEGLAFVQLDQSSEFTYCINKNGHIVFTLSGDYVVKVGFHNGLAVIQDDTPLGIKGTLYLCDSSGHITYAADLGGTHFLADISSMFASGYIFIANSTTDFTGPIETLGILNTDLEYIVEPSQELYSIYYSTYCDYDTTFYDGYLIPEISPFSPDKYLNLHTGTEETGLENLYAKMNIEYKSDFWDFDWYDIQFYDWRYRRLSDNIMIDLSQYEDTLSQIGSFYHGTAPLLFVSHSSIGSDGYFTILDENGAFLFDPVKTHATDVDIHRDQDLYLIVSISSSSYSPKSVTLELFNSNGKVDEFSFGYTRYIPTVSFSDGVIQVYDVDAGYTFYSTDFTPLF